MTALLLTGDRSVVPVDQPDKYGHYTQLLVADQDLDLGGHTLRVLRPSSTTQWAVQQPGGPVRLYPASLQGRGVPLGAGWTTKTCGAKLVTTRPRPAGQPTIIRNGRLHTDGQLFPLNTLAAVNYTGPGQSILVHGVAATGGAAWGNVEPVETAIMAVTGYDDVTLSALTFDGKAVSGLGVGINNPRRVWAHNDDALNTGHSHGCSIWTDPQHTNYGHVELTLTGMSATSCGAALPAASSQLGWCLNLEHQRGPAAGRVLVAAVLDGRGRAGAIRLFDSDLTAIACRIEGEITLTGGATFTAVDCTGSYQVVHR